MQQTDGQQWLLCPLWSWKHNKQRLYYFQVEHGAQELIPVTRQMPYG